MNKLAQSHFTTTKKVLVTGAVFCVLVTGGFVYQIQKANALAGINRTINFQGKLVNNPTKTNVNNTSYTVVFTIYDRASGGTALWSETQTVTTADGIFRVNLGSVTPFPSNFNFNWDGLYLGMKVGADNEMTPRIQLAAVPYAFNAEKVAGLTVQDDAGNASTSATLRIANNKTVTISNGLTFSGADGEAINFGSNSISFTTSADATLTLPTTGTLATLAGSEEFTNKTIGSTGLIFSGATTDITTVSNENFVISPNGSGRIGFNTTNPLASIDLRANSGTIAIASVSGSTSFAALLTDNAGTGDLFTASKSGRTAFVISNDGSVGINVANPSQKLDISHPGETGFTEIRGTAYGVSGTSNSPFFTGRSARGIKTNPAAVQQGDSLLNIGGQGYSSGFDLNVPVLMSFTADETWSASNTTGAYMAFTTTRNGTSTPVERMRIGSSGQVGLGSTTATSQLHVTRPLTWTTTGKALAVFDQIENQDIFTASSSGSTRFVIENDGDLKIATGRNLDVLSAGSLGIGSTNATSMTLGSSSLGSLTVTTDGSGNNELILPSQSIGSSEILDDTLDFTQFSSNLTIDEDTTVSFNTFNQIFDLTSTGTFLIRDAGNNFAQFLADGTITLGKAASASTLNIGIGAGADTINIGSDSTVGDTLVIGNNNASTTLSLVGGDDWSITTLGEATFTEFYGSGLADCDASTSKLLWNDATGTFSCGTDLGSNLQLVSFTDTTTELASFTSAASIWDGTIPNITPGSTNSKILVSVNIRGTSDDANDQNPVFTIRRAIGADPTCSDTQVGGEFVGTFLTTATQDWGANITTSDAPASTSNVRYIVCTTTTGADDGNTDDVRIVLTEIGSSSGGGGGNVSVRESDSSPSVASASTIEFGPATTSSDEFIVTDEGSGVARIRIGDQVGLLNEAETVTGGWTFNTTATTFTTGLLANGGIDTTSNTNLSLAANGSGNIVLSSDFNTGVMIGTSGNTPAPLSVRGGIGNNAALIVDQLNNGNIFAASSSGTTRFTIDNSGNLGVTASVNLSTGNVAFSSTGGITFTGGTILDNSDEVDINDDLAVAGNISLTGTSGLSFSGSGADITFTNSEQISNDTDGTITFGRNDAGTVILNARDNDATAALSILSGGAATLTLDTGGGAALNIGNTNASSLLFGNTGASTSLTFTKGASGNITLTGFNCSTLTNGGTLTTDASGNIECQNDDGGAATATYWDSSFGAIYPNIEAYDLLVGGTSTASAKFGFINVTSGTPTATISASNGNAIFMDANGNIQVSKARDLTLGGDTTGKVQMASNLRLSPDAGEGISGGGLTDCDNGGTDKLLWDSTTNKFSCGTDQGGTGGSLTVQEQDLNPSVSAVTTLQFGPVSTSSDEFIVTDEGAGKALVRIGNQVGMLNQAETVTGGWTFNTAATTFTTAINANGGLTTTTVDQNLAFSANGAGDFVFNVDSGTVLSLAGGADGNDALSIAAGDILLTDGDFDLSSGDFNVTLDAGDTANIIKTGANAGDVFNLAASSVNSIDGLQIDLTSTADSAVDTLNGIVFSWTESTDADVLNAINLGSTTSTNSVTTALTIGTGWDNGVVIGSGGLAVNGGSITSSLATLTIDAGGTVQISDNVTVTGTTGLTLSGAGADVVFANGESLTNDTDATLTLRRNNAGTVTLNAADDDSTAALTINSGGAAALTLDTGGAATLSIGTGNASTITIGNTTSGTGLDMTSGSGGINLGDSAVTRAIEIGGVDNNGSDTIRISTNATSADSINIGNANASTTMALTGGDDWSITSAGAATFSTFQGAGLSDCDTAGSSKLLWDTTSKTFSCGTDSTGSAGVMSLLGETTLGASSTTLDVTLSSSTEYVSCTIAGPAPTGTGIIHMRFNSDSGAASYGWTAATQLAGANLSDTQDASDDTIQLTGTNTPSTDFIFKIYFDNVSGNVKTVQWDGTVGKAVGTVSDWYQGSGNFYTTTGQISSVNFSRSANSFAAGTYAFCEGKDVADYAENYYTKDKTVQAADVVTSDPSLPAGIQKATKPYDSKLIGVISTKPAITLDDGIGFSQGAPRPVALSGRVPVKVSTINGPIKAGDLLTSSSIPGVAMRANKSGAVIGQAMESFDGEGIGKVMTFVKTTEANGSIGETLNNPNVNIESATFSEDALSELMNRENDGLSGSEVVTDTLIAAKEIVTPKLTVNELHANKIIVGEIEGLTEFENRISMLEEKVATLSANLVSQNNLSVQVEYATISSQLAENNTKLEQQNKLMQMISEQLASSSANYDSKTSDLSQVSSLEDSLRVKGNALIEGVLNIVDSIIANNLIANGLSTFFGDAIFKSKTSFEGSVTFSNEFGGTAVIEKDAEKVEVIFDKEFESTPILNATVTFDELRDEKGNLESSESLRREYFAKEYEYIIIDKSKKGFVIVLNKKAESDITFTWTAIRVKDAKNIQSRKPD